MKYTLFLILIVVVPAVCAGDEWIYTTSYFNMSTSITASIVIQKTSANPELDYVKAQLFFVPQEDYRQKLIKIVTNPEGKVQDNYIEFMWNKPTQDQLIYQVKADLVTHYSLPQIRTKIPFPVQNLDPGLYNYTQPTNLIDSDNEEIIMLASNLASGRDDMYDVVFALSDWVLLNVNYSLNTVTAKVSKKASWVVENKYGVCDEITTLFVALCRSLGIPARYVGGLAYTNYQNINDFGPHAWAEVYFPGVGWVPYDITYGEFGYVDATHIKLKVYQDPDESATKYEWRGRDVDIGTSQLDMHAKMTHFGPMNSDLFTITSTVLKSNVGFGSYNLLEADIQNLNPFYVSTSVAVIKSEEVSILGPERIHLFLKPLESKKVFWLLKLQDSLNPDYIYTFPLSVYSVENISGSTEFESQVANPVYDYATIQDSIKTQVDEAQKVYSHNVTISCAPNESFYYVHDTVMLVCFVKNTGNTMLRTLKLCLQQECHVYDLGINQERIVNFSKIIDTDQENSLKITATNSLVSKTVYVPVTVYERPHIELVNITYPPTVTYTEDYKVSFLLNKTTRAEPYNVTIFLSSGDASKQWSIAKLAYSQEFDIQLSGKDLNPDANSFTLHIRYQDRDAKVYDQDQDFSVVLTKVTFFQRIDIFLRQLSLKLEHLLSNS